MINKYLKGLITISIIVVLFVVSSFVVRADSDENVWCHHYLGNGTCEENQFDSCNGIEWQNGVCPEETITPTPTPTPEETITPSPTPEPTSTPAETTTNTGGTGASDGRSDGLGCGSHDCSNQQQQATQAVLGASTGPQVLGLSTTSSGSNSLLNLFQLLGATTLSVFGFSFLKKNA